MSSITTPTHLQRPSKIEPRLDDSAFAEQLEPIARKIELLETTAILQIAAEAAKIHENFRYRRGEGGYTGYMKRRLGYSSSSAYRLLDVHTRFGRNVSQVWEGLPVSAVYLLAAPATPEDALNEVAKRIEAGEKPTCAMVTEVIAKAKNKGIDNGEAVDDGDDASTPRSPGARGAHDGDNAPQDHDGDADGVAKQPDGADGGTPDHPDEAANHAAGEHDLNGVGTGAAPAPAEPAPDPATIAAAAVNQLSPTELQSFLDQLSQAHLRAFEQKFGARNSDHANVEIATLAGECTALLAHPQQHIAEIYRRLARIKRLAGGKGRDSSKSPGKSNAHLDLNAFARGLGLAGQPGKTFPTMTMTPDGVDASGQPTSYGLPPAGRSRVH